MRFVYAMSYALRTQSHHQTCKNDKQMALCRMENGKLTKQRTKHYYFISKYCHSWHNTNNHTLSLSRMVCWSIHCICRRVSVFSSSFIHSWIVHFNQTSLVAIKLWSYSHTENRHKHRVTQTNNNHNNKKKLRGKSSVCFACFFFAYELKLVRADLHLPLICVLNLNI